MECVSMDNDNPLTQLRFEAAVKVIRSLPPDGSFQPSNDMMLKFYSYFKQATLGPCNIPRPGFWDAVGKAKWDAWSSLGDMSKEDAMAAYVEEMKLILEGMPITGEVEELLRVMGPFYELVEEKKRITQISDLSAGLGSMLSSMPSKSVTKSIIRTMEMNGSLEDWPARGRPQISAGETKEEEDEEDDDDEDEEEEEEEEEYDLTREVGKDKQSTASLPNRKASTRRTKVPLSNGKANGVPHLTNGSQPKATVNGSISAPESRINGHPAEPSKDVSGVVHLASDSDSEVYCDSVDQFGQEEGSELNRSLDDLDEDENQSPTALEEETHSHGTLEDLPGPLGGTQRGGEEVESGAGSSRRKSLNGDTSDRSPVRGGRGSRTAGGVGSGVLGNWQGGGGDGDRERWGGGATTPSGSLNEQIVVALARLQEDMQSVLDRLHTLEALGATQARSLALSPTFVPPPVNKTSKKPRWWPFDISFSAVAFAVIWPFVVQWLIRLYLQRRKRRIN